MRSEPTTTSRRRNKLSLGQSTETDGKQTSIKTSGISFLLYFFLFIIGLGIGDYVYLKLQMYHITMQNSQLTDVKKYYIPLVIVFLIETIGLLLLWLFYQRMKPIQSIQLHAPGNRRNVDNEIMNADIRQLSNLRQTIFFTGASLTIIAMALLTLSLVSGVPTPFYVANDTYLLVCGVLFMLNIYLTPAIRTIDLSALTELQVKVNETKVKLDPLEKIELVPQLVKLPETEASPEQKIPYQFRDFSDYMKTINTSDGKAEFRMQTLIKRLADQNTDIQKQANVNLILGVVVAICGLVALLLIVYSTPNIALDTTASKFNYFSRLSLVVFIELLAIFFLRLYKESLNDKKYYQNELTNVEMKYIALTSAKEADLPKVIEQLASTERNFKLGKDETTVNLKHFEVEKDYMDKALAKVEGIIGKLKG